MGRPELGAKRTCTGCNERFYDLHRAPAVCPKCGVQQAPEKPRVYLKPATSWRSSRQPPVPVAAVDDDRAAEVPVEEKDDDEDVPELDADADAEVESVEEDVEK